MDLGKGARNTAVIELNELFFDEWRVERLAEENDVYHLYALRSTQDETKRASLWAVDFPACAAEFSAALDKGLTAERADAFFAAAASDFVACLHGTSAASAASGLLTAENVELRGAQDERSRTVVFRTVPVCSLAMYRRSHPMHFDDAIRLGVSLCRALRYCRENALPRRLLTQDNLFVTEDGAFLLGNFGKEDDIRFQAPEEHRGEVRTEAAEICSVGVLLYTMLNNGMPPLVSHRAENPTAEDLLTAARRRLSGEPLPPPKNATGAMTGIVLKACSYKPKARYETLEQLQTALQGLRSANHSVGETTVGEAGDATEKRIPRNRRRERAVKKTVAGIATGLAVLLVSALLLRSYDKQHENDPTLPPPVAEQTALPATEAPVPSQDVSVETPAQTPTELVQPVAYPEGFFDQIGVYHSGNFHMHGTIYKSDGSVTVMELAVSSDNTVYMTTEIEDANVGMLRDKDGTIYIVYPEGKTYLELNAITKKMLGVDEKVMAGMSYANYKSKYGMDDMPTAVEKRSLEGVERTACIYQYDGGKYEVMYVDDDGKLLRMEFHHAAEEIDYHIDVASITGDVPQERKAPAADYKGYSGTTGFIGFMGSLASALSSSITTTGAE